MFSDELKECTVQVHQGLEKKLVGRIKKIATIDDYIDLLVLMYGFYTPLQQRIEPFLVIPQNLAVNAYRQQGREARSILDDIEFLSGKTPDDLPLCEYLPEISSYASAIGGLYVTEGSTLGGQIITQMISKKLKMPTDRGFSFFKAYGDNTHDMWNNFKAILNGNFSEQQKHEIRTSALSTFITFGEWINLYTNEPAIN